MKKIYGFACVAILALVCVSSAAAQKQPSKDEWFQQIAKLSNTKKEADYAKAYEQAKEFLAKYGADTDDKVKKIREFAVKYRQTMFDNAIVDIRMADALEFGKDILADEPENVTVMLGIAYGSFQAYAQKKDNGYGAPGIQYARRALELLAAGKLPSSFSPFKDKNESSAWMHYVVGVFSIEFDLKDAVVNLYRAIQFQSEIKDDIYPYLVIANYYEKRYEVMAADFQRIHGAKREEDAALKADRAKINEIVDRMIDVYARAVKVGEAKKAPSVVSLKDQLSKFFKYRRGETSGLDAYLASIASTPMPEPN